MTLAAGERITHETLDALARWSAIARDALCPRATDEAVALCVTISTISSFRFVKTPMRNFSSLNTGARGKYLGVMFGIGLPR